MPGRKTLQLTVDVPADPATVFDAMTDWDHQHEWMLGTRVRAAAAGGRGEGGGIEAFTGIGPIGFWDTMTITRWEEPRVVEVSHTGHLVRGIGIFRVEPAAGGARFVWREEVDPPLGRLGALGWYLVKPALAAGVAYSLRRFARFAAARPPVRIGQGDAKRAAAG
jgi:uncharacterized protein YndB with AHSA1/START domain